MGTSRGKKMVLRKWEKKIKSRRRDLRGVKPGRWERRKRKMGDSRQREPLPRSLRLSF